MFNERLASLREKVGLSQKELATRLKMARTTYSGYENGSREPDHETLNRIADFFEVTTDYLLCRTNNPKQSLSGGAKEFLRIIDLSDDKAIEALKNSFVHQGKQLSDEAAMEIIRYARFRAEQN